MCAQVAQRAGWGGGVVPLLNPALFAGALACVAIPILIHLLMRRRRKPIRWAAMRFLVEAYQRQRKRLLIERWLLLAVRCLAVLFLALALGRPAHQASGLDAPGARTVYLLVDDSLTATALDASGRPAVERNAAMAKELLSTLDASRGDRAGVISLSRPARGVVMAPSGDLAGVGEVLDGLEPTDAAADVGGAMGLVLDDLAESASGQSSTRSGPVVVAVFSEWLAGTAGEETAMPELPGDARMHVLISPPRQAEPSTVGIELAEPVRGVTVGDDVGGGRLRVRLRREGSGNALATRVVLRSGDGSSAWSPPVGETLVRWSAGQTTAETVVAFDRAALTGGRTSSALRIEIDPDDLPGDDVRYAAVDLRQSLRIGLASSAGFDHPTSVRDYGPAEWVRLSLRPGGDASTMELIDLPATGLERERLVDLSAIVLVEPARVSNAGWARLREFVARGGLLLVSPGADEGGDASPVWLVEMNQQLNLGWVVTAPPVELEEALTIEPELAAQNALLSVLGPELEALATSVPVRRRLGLEAQDAQVVIALSDGSPLVVASPSGDAPERGLVVLLTTSLDLGWTDLPARGLMVPMMQELVRQGVAVANPTRGSIAGDLPSAPVGTSELRLAGATPVLIERASAVRTAGVWRGQDAQGATTGLTLVNPDARAGQSRVRTTEEVVAWFGDQTTQTPLVIGDETAAGTSGADGEDAQRIDAGWALPAILALLLALVLDALLGRRFSHAEQSVRTSGGVA
jgi:hypothetical protein